MAYTLKELREVSDEQLIVEHDLKAQSTDPGINYYLDELKRREQNRQTETIIKYTHRMLLLTVFIALLTIVNVMAVFAPLFRQ